MNLDVTNHNPKPISFNLEGDVKVEVDVQYKNIPYSECLLVGHLTAKCPFAAKRGILRTPDPIIIHEKPAIPRNEDLIFVAVAEGGPGLHSNPFVT